MAKKSPTKAGVTAANESLTSSPSRHSHRQASIAAQGSSSRNTPEEGRNRSTGLTQMFPGTLRNAARGKAHYHARGSTSRSATTSSKQHSDTESAHDDKDDDDEEEYDTVDDQVSEYDMRSRILAQWKHTPEEVIPVDLLHPERRGQTLERQWVAVLNQICALDVDLMLARSAFDEVLDEAGKEYLDLEELKKAVGKAEEFRDDTLEPESDVMSRERAISETKGENHRTIEPITMERGEAVRKEITAGDARAGDRGNRDGTSDADAEGDDDPPAVEHSRRPRRRAGKTKESAARRNLPALQSGLLQEREDEAVDRGENRLEAADEGNDMVERKTSSNNASAKTRAQGEGFVKGFVIHPLSKIAGATKKGDKRGSKAKTPAEKRKPSGAAADEGNANKRQRRSGRNDGKVESDGDARNIPQRPARSAAGKANAKAARPKDRSYRLGLGEDQVLKAYAHHLPFCAQVKGQRYTFRICRDADDLADWADHERGKPKPPHSDDREDATIDQLAPTMINHLTHAFNQRSHIEGTYETVTEADAAEGRLVQAVYQAYDDYVDELSNRGLYPIHREAHLEPSVIDTDD